MDYVTTSSYVQFCSSWRIHEWKYYWANKFSQLVGKELQNDQTETHGSRNSRPHKSSVNQKKVQISHKSDNSFIIVRSTSGSRLSIRMDYAPFLIQKIIKPLRDQGVDGVEEALSVMKEYHLLREDIDSLIELTTWPGKKNPMDGIEGKVKAALTRAYNKEVSPYTYTATAAIKKKKAEKNEEIEAEYGAEEDGVCADASDDEEENESVESDVLIKAKKRATSTKSSDSASTSKKKAGSSSRKAKK